MAGVKGRSGGARKGAGRKSARSYLNFGLESAEILNRKKGKHGGARPGSGPKPFVPTAADRSRVEACKGFGLTDEQIAVLVFNPATGLPITAEMLRDRFRVELACGLPKAISAVASSLFMNATRNNNVAAQIFFLKTRAKWSETLNVTVRRPEDMSDEELDAAIAAAIGDEPSGEDRALSSSRIPQATTGESSTRH